MSHLLEMFSKASRMFGMIVEVWGGYEWKQVFVDRCTEFTVLQYNEHCGPLSLSFLPFTSSSHPFYLSPFPSLPPPSVVHVLFLPHFCLYPSPQPFPRSVCIPFVKKLDGKINFHLEQPAKKVNPLVTLWMQTQIFELIVAHVYTHSRTRSRN